jgi:hypothetical protein
MDFVRKYEEIVRVFTICTLLVSKLTKHIHVVLLSPLTSTVRCIYTRPEVQLYTTVSIVLTHTVFLHTRVKWH